MIKPTFHFQPVKNWMNDPNGMSFINGQFHMFFQHNPYAPVWGNMTWGHAVSPDMVHWRRLPHALYPDKPYDRDGVFSGCCVVKDGLPHIIYTGVYPETVCLATGDREGMHFDKYEGNPILTNGGRRLQGWRDPYIWPEAGGYCMILGSGEADGLGFTELYKSVDLYHWAYAGKLAQAEDYALPDVMWECPMLLLEGSCAALFVSAIPGFEVRTIIGRYEEGLLKTGTAERTDGGDCFYAPGLVRHPDGRWIMFGWLREYGDEELRIAQGWQGMLSLPRTLWFEDGSLRVWPAKEVDSLRGACAAHKEDTKTVTEETGAHMEMVVRYCLRGGSLVFELLRDASGRCVQVVIDANGMTVGRCKWDSHATPLYMPMKTAEDCGQVRIFTDGTVLELYRSTVCVMTTRVYPEGEIMGVRANALGNCVMNEADVYIMNDCYRD